MAQVVVVDDHPIARMGVSNKTVSTYKSRLMDKLHCKTMSDLFAFVHRNQMEAS